MTNACWFVLPEELLKAKSKTEVKQLMAAHCVMIAAKFVLDMMNMHNLFDPLFKLLSPQGKAQVHELTHPHVGGN